MSGAVWTSSDGALSIQYRTFPTESLEAVLEETIWGSQDVKYMVRRIPELLGRIPDPHYITLETKQGDVFAGVVAARKRTRIAGRDCDAIHIAFIAVSPARLGFGYGSLLGKHAKAFLLDLLGEAGVLYLFVETTHRDSMKLHRSIGYESLCDVQTRMFCRLSPRLHPAVRPLRRDELTAMVVLLDAQYVNHVLADFAQSTKFDEYHVLEHEGRIVAGVQASELHWSLISLEGVGGVIALKLLPKIPLLKRIYDPSDLKLLRIGNVYVEAGHERALSTLLQSVVASHHVHLGMMFFDQRSAVHRQLEACINFGVATRLVRVSARIFVAFKGVSERDVAQFRVQPIHLSPMDAL